uniref:GNAT family N-acetyltransferase n=1 Tax=Acetatifactor sp. TaxID=1872090 RepID=UPI004056706C
MLETKDLIIKKAEQKDWRDMYYNLWRHSESAKYMLWNITTSEEEAQKRMARTIDFEASHDFTWLIYEKQSGQAIGFAGLEEFKPQVYKETGIAIGPAFTGKGYGKQVLNALMEYARDELGAKKFIACCRTNNIVSHNLQMSCGFHYSHTEHKTDPRNGEAYTLEYNYKEL